MKSVLALLVTLVLAGLSGLAHSTAPDNTPYRPPSFEEFLENHYLPSVPLGEGALSLGPLRRLLQDDDAFVEEKNMEREETINKLKIYLIGGVLIGGLVYFLQRAVHDSNNRNGCIEMIRNNFFFRWCCFAPRTDYQPVTADEESGDQKAPPPPSAHEEPEFSVTILALCVTGLLVSYLTWGFFQEMLMTQNYMNVVTNQPERFKNAEFLVFLNRLSGLLISTIAVRYTSPHLSYSPPYKFLFCSMSNILSAWFQYEALKFITFPMQVLAKSCKVMFTMLMGVAIDNKSFSKLEYLNALLIALGLAVFKYGQDSGPATDDSLTARYFLIGVTLIVGYICSDSFTSNWQARIFRLHKISSLQMMMGVNIFSASFSLMTSAPQLFSTLAFFRDHPLIMLHAGLMSCCSGTGQLFIFYTIQRFGAVVFAVAMTARLIISVLLSVVWFRHPINSLGFVGMAITFLALIVRVDMKRRAVRAKQAARAAQASVELQQSKGTRA